MGSGDCGRAWRTLPLLPTLPHVLDSEYTSYGSCVLKMCVRVFFLNRNFMSTPSIYSLWREKFLLLLSLVFKIVRLTPFNL